MITLDIPGASETFALGINDSGLVVGCWDLLDADGNTLAVHGFTSKDGAFTNTQIDFPGAAATGIFGINARGDFVGVWLPDLISGIEHGFACPNTGQCFSFDAPVPGTVLTQADDINALGQIVGVYIGADGIEHAFLMVGATFTSFDFPGATGTGAYGINSAGQIVGKYLHPMDQHTGFWRTQNLEGPSRFCSSSDRRGYHENTKLVADLTYSHLVCEGLTEGQQSVNHCHICQCGCLWGYG